MNYTHQGKIDVIYIDPPYNTGNKSWKYNNQYVEKDDTYKHSKWLSFMSKRLRLAKNLLKDEGIIIVTIDDYEIGNLNLLMNEIFGEGNKLGVVTIMHNPRGRSDDKYFATSHEYALFYGLNTQVTKTNKLKLTEEQVEGFPLEDEISFYRLLPLKRTGSNSTPDKRPNLFYPIYYNKKTKRVSVEEEKNKDLVKILPIDSHDGKRVWRWGKVSFTEKAETEIVIKENNGKYTVFAKDRIKGGRKPKTVWADPKYDASSHGTILLQKILGKSRSFDYPKSLYAVFDTLQICIDDNKEAIVLDFFAGSGTTGHAVLELNRKDGGNRKFILCTNNENEIAEEVCYPRIKKCMSGYPRLSDHSDELKYFKTAFVKRTFSKDTLKIRITKECTEMLCLREGIFEEKKKTDDYRIFEQGERIMAVYYSPDRTELKSLKKELDKMTGEKTLYCFELDPFGLDKNDFHDWKGVTLEPIPQKILDIYEDIYEY
ncbi:MAG: site-specific DNA-methyltransferase [Planctomycetota bacterium]